MTKDTNSTKPQPVKIAIPVYALAELFAKLLAESSPDNDDAVPFDIIDTRSQYQVIRKGNPSLTHRFNRVPFVINDNDRLALELYPIKLALLYGKEPKVVWNDLVKNFHSKLNDHDQQEELLEQAIIHELINISGGEVTLKALNCLANRGVSFYTKHH